MPVCTRFSLAAWTMNVINYTKATALKNVIEKSLSIDRWPHHSSHSSIIFSLRMVTQCLSSRKNLLLKYSTNNQNKKANAIISFMIFQPWPSSFHGFNSTENNCEQSFRYRENSHMHCAFLVIVSVRRLRRHTGMHKILSIFALAKKKSVCIFPVFQLKKNSNSLAHPTSITFHI